MNNNESSKSLFNWDPLNTQAVFGEMFSQMAQNPEKLFEANMQLWQQGLEIYQQSIQNVIAGEVTQQDDSKPDRRFRHDAWTQQPVFNAIRQCYLMYSDYIMGLVNQTEQGMNPHNAARAEFFSRLFVDAMSPTNFVNSNPEVLEKAIETNGMSLVNGMQNMLKDIQRGDGKLKISMTDYSAFELGKNIATTPGKVVFENRMFQLIQYQPTTENVHARPLLIVPPWINKYYILDLQEKNSLIHWLVEQGHSVFVMSWVNPDERYAEVGFEEYVKEGIVTALDAIEQATGESHINAIGYCIGGTLLATTLAYLSAKGDDRIDSATFFTAMLDFEEPGELGLFIDEEQLSALEEEMDEKGYLDGSSMSNTFNLLRSNDLIWSFYVNNYLLGNDPTAFDLLYWNSDSTRMPAKMHKWYLRNLYLENNLVEAGKLSIDGVPIDLANIKIPTVFVSTVDDHIAPWQSTWSGARKLGGPVKFILGGSGHIAGVVNPPAKKKYGYRISTAKLGKDSQAWAEKTKVNEGSWWPAWQQWIKKYQGEDIPARLPGDGKLDVIEDAPGRYVKTKIVNI